MVYSAGLITFFIWAIFNRHCSESIVRIYPRSIRKILAAKIAVRLFFLKFPEVVYTAGKLIEMGNAHMVWMLDSTPSITSWPVSHLLCSTQNNILQVRSTMKHPGPVEKFVPPLGVSGAAYRSLCNYKFLPDPRDRWAHVTSAPPPGALGKYNASKEPSSAVFAAFSKPKGPHKSVVIGENSA